MRAQIEILATLQKVDREIKEKTGIKQGLLGEIQAKEKEILAKKQEIAEAKAAYAEKDKVRQEKDRLFQEESKKAVERRMRMGRIKNAKELQALQREIDQIKQANSELEEELIKLMEELETVKAGIKAKEEELAKLQEEWTRKRDELQAQISGIDQAVSEAATRRQTIASQLAGDLISRYELIFSRRNGTAVVEVAGGICQGCYMNIPPQLWNEIIKSEKVNLCPSCQRILYYKSNVTQEKPA
ncbi:MAG TPA: C4-type zinc ribbon domain-containing protein [candidate division Zixibacteria bacterium]|nr:C4-type zinc ribbon domain-containing protein [candidate division Zixibacteria bacterium]